MKVEIIVHQEDDAYTTGEIIGVINLEMPAVPRKEDEIVFPTDAGQVLIRPWEGGESRTFDNQGGDRRYLEVTRVMWEVREGDVVPVIWAKIENDHRTLVVFLATMYPQKIFATTIDGRYTKYSRATWKDKELSPMPDEEYSNILWEGQDTWNCLVNGKEKTVQVREIKFTK